MSEYYVPAVAYHRNKYNLRIRPASVRIQPYVEKQGNVIRLNIKESYIPRTLNKLKKITSVKRSIIKQWTSKSRKRLLEKLLMIDLNKQNIYVSLLTYSTEFKPFLTPKLLRLHKHKFFVYLNRLYKDMGIVWKLEFTRAGMPHLHLLLTNPSPVNLIYLRWNIARIWNHILYKDFHDVISHKYFKLVFRFHNKPDNTQVMKSQGIIHYYSSYMTKYKNKEYQNNLPDYLISDDESFRFWGISSGKNILTYETERVELTYDQYYNLRDKCIIEISKKNKFYYNNNYGLTYYINSDSSDIIDNDFVNLLFENSSFSKPCLLCGQSEKRLTHKHFNDYITIPDKVEDIQLLLFKK